jgi:hypothetical protein
MDRATATRISAEWLRQGGVIVGARDAVANLLERVIAKCDAHGYTPKENGGRLAVLADRELWIGTAPSTTTTWCRSTWSVST